MRERERQEGEVAEGWVPYSKRGVGKLNQTN